MIKTRLLSKLLWLVSLLPLSGQHFLGSILGRLFWLTSNRERSATRLNLKLCYPEKPDKWRKQLGQKSLIETGKALVETGAMWHWNQNRLTSLVRNVCGQSIMDSARSKNKGVILASPHIGAWELIGVYVGSRHTMINMYRPPRSAAMEPIIKSARERFGAKVAPANPSGIRVIFKALREQNIVGILPDQEPDRENGLFAPLFNTPACTMTLLGKLARKSNAPIVFCTMKRLENGYELHYIEPDPDIYSEDPLIAATSTNRTIEQCIAIAPEQYLWSYRRFRLLPSTGKRKYH